MRYRDSIRRIATLAALVACSLTAVWHLWPKVTVWHQRHLASQLAEKIKVVGDDKVTVPLRQLASLGAAAVPSLVEASASDRTIVAEQARQIINELFDSWQFRAEASSGFDIVLPATTLAAALADQIDNFGPRGKQWVESLTLRLIVLAEEIPPNLASKMLEDCAHILAAVPASGPRLRNVQTTTPHTFSTSTQSQAIPSMPLATFAVPTETVMNTPRSTSNNFQQRPADLPANPKTISTKPLSENQPPSSSTSDWSPEWRDGNAHKPLAKPLATVAKQPAVPPLPIPSKRPRKTKSQIVDIPSPAEMNQQIKRLRQKTSSELVHLLPHGDIFSAGPIRAVLRERGITDAEMDLSKQYTSTQIDDRLKLINDLSILPSATARRWLRWLLKDENAEVRLRALSAIATTADPTLYKVARDMTVNDKDPRVAKLASQIMEQARK